MKKPIKTLILSLVLCTSYLLAEATTDLEIMKSHLNKYKAYLKEGTISGQDFGIYSKYPLERDFTFEKAFTYFIENNGKVIVELGTTRSFVHGGLIGCNEDDPKYWTPDQPKNWDWGAGSFTRVAAECLEHMDPEFHTVDLIAPHINRCKLITKPFSSFMYYHLCSSVDFLSSEPSPQSIDLLYIDTGDMTPIEPTAQLQLEEAKVICKRDLMAPNGIIVIDDIKNTTPKIYGESSDFGKGKYSIPYFLSNGFELLHDEYQVILQKQS